MIALQMCLLSHGFDPGSPDGVFGPKTERAVIAFQEANELKKDGIAGPLTIGKLKAGTNDPFCAALNG
ncbi:peptidoglycan-binding domain-containing protein [Caldinitratiruptor microaerophilus]|uniref:peptidoglycan-binding domain-containing protein n=1 Tax=Caldinitratiruptor microaerophilus TaxID=671077 RepID=UPI00222E89ED|nr:peptidoglycan-binding domain-containing protein [Caldinitratiruptor microaerophilus]